LSIEPAAAPNAPPLLLKVLNNVFASSLTVPVLHVASLPDKSNLWVEGNAYINPSGNYRIEWGDASSTETADKLAAWLAGIGLEGLGRSYAQTAGSMLPLVLFTPDGKGPEKLTDLQTYLLVDGSPLLNVGLNIMRSLGIDAGDRDFWGNKLSKDGNPDTGACECSARHPAQ
jgi:hypothetical protein